MLHFLAVLGVIVLVLVILFVVYAVCDALNRLAVKVNDWAIDWYLERYGSESDDAGGQ